MTGNQKYDPIRAVRTNSQKVNQAFLKNGEALNPLQRIGIIMISLMVIGWAVYFGFDAADAFSDSSPRFPICAGMSLFGLTIGALAIRNALRFPRKSKKLSPNS